MKKFHITWQRLIGLAMILLSIAVLLVCSDPDMPGNKDAGAVLFLDSFGLFIILSK